MQLLNNLYTLSHSQISEAEGQFRLRLNTTHAIYKSHFPGMPVTPGVCLCAIARELVEKVLGRPLQLTAVKNAKFLKVLSPTEYPNVVARVKRATTTSENTTTAQVTIETLEGEAFVKISITASIKEA